MPSFRRVRPAMPIHGARGQGETPRSQRLSTEGRGVSSATGIPCPLPGLVSSSEHPFWGHLSL